MSIPKKGSRSLVVDGIRYRWAVRRSDEFEGTNRYGFDTTLTVAIAKEDNPQNVLCLFYPCGFHHRAKDDAPRRIATGTLAQITPQNVADAIRMVRQHGWDPDRKSARYLVPIDEYRGQ